jgi:transcriptional regulator with XRE-family HTH domain
VSSEAFRDKLEQLGLSQAEFSHLLGVDFSAVFRWSKGDRAVPPPVETCLILIEALGVAKARKRIEAARSSRP